MSPFYVDCREKPGGWRKEALPKRGGFPCRRGLSIGNSCIICQASLAGNSEPAVSG